MKFNRTSNFEGRNLNTTKNIIMPTWRISVIFGVQLPLKKNRILRAKINDSFEKQMTTKLYLKDWAWIPVKEISGICSVLGSSR